MNVKPKYFFFTSILLLFNVEFEYATLITLGTLRQIFS